MAFLFFFFKQKTAYEMRISDWSSDVCSSDLEHLAGAHRLVELHVADDAARHEAGDLHEADVDAVIAGHLQRHTLVLLGGIVEGRVDELAGAVGQRRDGAVQRDRSEDPTSELPSPMCNAFAIFFLHQNNQT